MLESRRALTVAVLAVAVVLVAMSWAIQRRILRETKSELATSLATVLATTHQALSTWERDLEASASISANRARTRELTAVLLDTDFSPDELLKSPAQEEMRSWLGSVTRESGYRGFFVVGPGNVNLSSSRDSNVGVPSLVVDQGDFLTRLWEGGPALSLPLPSDVPLPGKDGGLLQDAATMFVGAPITSPEGRAIAVLLFRVDPYSDFSELLQRGRLGESGETYAFDAGGRLVSESRFTRELRAAGLLAPGQASMLNIELRDPGVDLTSGERSTVPREQQPLTHMAARATQGATGTSTEPYRDYRGVPVIGAWLWDESLRLGITTEIDADDAFRVFRETRSVLTGSTIVTVALLVALAALLARGRRRILRLNRELEARVRERTAELQEHVEEIQKLSRATDESPASVLITRKDGVIEYVNARFTQVTGYRPEEALGETPRILKSGLQPPELYEELWSTILAGEAWRGELQNKKKSGEVYWVFVSISPVRDRDGRITHFIGVQEDMTNRKRMEEQLVVAKEAAEAATEARSAFLANMSHEIRTPLNGIIGFGTLMARTDLSARQRDYLRKIDVSSNTLLNLINDILDFSKIEAGKLDIEATDFRLEDVLEELADLFADRAAQSDIELIIGQERNVPGALVGDALRLRQILVNLTGNAVKFTEGGEIFVNVCILGEKDDPVRLRFSVRDTGIGISPEKVDTLFDSFTQADGSTTRKYGGTGLGLSISRELVELMDGRIGAESEPGEGSTFWFELPFRRGEDPGEPRHQLRTDLRGLKVLVVDDNEVSRRILAEMLGAFGYAVDTASGGDEALGILHEAASGDSPYQLVLVDWRMPGMGGLELSRRIREANALAELPIVMVTAFGRDEERRESASIGVDAFLSKPVQQSVLFNTLMEVFDQAGKEDASRYMVTEESLTAGRLAGAHILLAEDNVINQEVAESLLRSEGVAVDIASNGREALERVRQRPYDAVLMDMQMPELDGYEAARRIREDAALDRLPIIAMTAHAMAGDRERCLEAGMNDYVTKPVDPAQLFETLARWVSPRAGADVAPAGAAPQHSAEGRDALDELPGIDTEAALHRLRGNRQLYRKLLDDVVRNHTEDAERIQHALESGRPEEARAVAHTLKGIAGNLSIVPLQDAAADLESAIATASADAPPGPATLSRPLGRLRAALGDAVGAIRSLGTEAPERTDRAEPVSGETIDPEQIASAAGRVRRAAEIGDLTAIEEALDAVPEGLHQRARLRELADAFDFSGLAEAAGELERGEAGSG